ncbi:hypothetical protein [Salinibaculum rarum]|nr:hypothetical protein [Salinibaculum sp. KK48]
MDSPLARFDHPAYVTGVATAMSYGLILGVMFVLFFVVPFLLFTLL